MILNREGRADSNFYRGLNMAASGNNTSGACGAPTLSVLSGYAAEGTEWNLSPRTKNVRTDRPFVGVAGNRFVLLSCQQHQTTQLSASR